MAKLNLKGLTIDKLLNMADDELLALARQGLNRSTMTEKEFVKARRDNLAQIVSRVVSTANKRINQLGKSELGRNSPAYQQAQKMSPSGKFSVRGQNFNQLRNTMKEAKEWLNYKTSTAKGWKEVRARIREDVGMEFDTKYKEKKFWEVYRRLQDSNSGTIKQKGSASRLASDRIQRMIANIITKRGNNIDWRSSVDRILEQAQKSFNNEYEIEKRETEMSDVGASRIVEDIDDEE